VLKDVWSSGTRAEKARETETERKSYLCPCSFSLSLPPSLCTVYDTTVTFYNPLSARNALRPYPVHFYTAIRVLGILLQEKSRQ
jgi:hypothetical protein